MTVRRSTGLRPAVGALLGTLGVLTLSACASFGAAGDDDTIEASEQAAADLREELAGMPGFTDPYVAYQDNATLQAHLEVSVEVADATQLEAALPVIEEAAWLSRVEPLQSLTLTVVPPTGPGIGEDYDLADQQTVADLTERWGERP